MMIGETKKVASLHDKSPFKNDQTLDHEIVAYRAAQKNTLESRLKSSKYTLIMRTCGAISECAFHLSMKFKFGQFSNHLQRSKPSIYTHTYHTWKNYSQIHPSWGDHKKLEEMIFFLKIKA